MDTGHQAIFALLIITTAVIFGLLIVSMLQLHFRYKKDMLHRMETNRLKAEYDQSLMSARNEMQEMAFQYISYEIHDNIKNSLTLAQIYIDSLATAEEDEGNRKIRDAVAMIGKSVDDLSDLSRSLNTDLILTGGLISALNEELERIKRMKKVSVSLDVSGEQRDISGEREVLVFRIIQESLSNAIKHAKAQKITVELTFIPDELKVVIADNGTGFENPGTGKKKGLGLNSIKKRVTMLKGDIDIHSISGSGTTISLNVPLLTQEFGAQHL